MILLRREAFVVPMRQNLSLSNDQKNPRLVALIGLPFLRLLSDKSINRQEDQALCSTNIAISCKVRTPEPHPNLRSIKRAAHWPLISSQYVKLQLYDLFCY
jgi:hypothetical protein